MALRCVNNVCSRVSVRTLVSMSRWRRVPKGVDGGAVIGSRSKATSSPSSSPTTGRRSTRRRRAPRRASAGPARARHRAGQPHRAGRRGQVRRRPALVGPRHARLGRSPDRGLADAGRRAHLAGGAALRAAPPGARMGQPTGAGEALPQRSPSARVSLRRGGLRPRRRLDLAGLLATPRRGASWRLVAPGHSRGHSRRDRRPVS